VVEEVEEEEEVTLVLWVTQEETVGPVDPDLSLSW